MPTPPNQEPAHDPTSLTYALARALALKDGNGWAFTATSNSPLVRDLINDYVRQAAALTAAMPAAPATYDPAVAARVTGHLTAAWGWLPDEREAAHLGVNFARAAALLVDGTRTTPDNLLDALIGGPAAPVPAAAPDKAAVLGITRDLVADRGNNVAEWPDDEAATYRASDGTIREGMQAVADLRAEKGARAILDALPGRNEHTVKEEALRDAAAQLIGTPAWHVVLELAEQENRLAGS